VARIGSGVLVNAIFFEENNSSAFCSVATKKAVTTQGFFCPGEGVDPELTMGQWIMSHGLNG